MLYGNPKNSGAFRSTCEDRSTTSGTPPNLRSHESYNDLVVTHKTHRSPHHYSQDASSAHKARLVLVNTREKHPNILNTPPITLFSCFYFNLLTPQICIIRTSIINCIYTMVQYITQAKSFELKRTTICNKNKTPMSMARMQSENNVV
jgi:hypothetical protein